MLSTSLKLRTYEGMEMIIFDGQQSGVVYSFVCVCLSVCNTIVSGQSNTFESLDIFIHPLHLDGVQIKYVKVIGSRSRLQFRF